MSDTGDIEDIFGVKREDLEKVRDFNQTLKIDVWTETNKPVYKLRILSDKPRKVSWTKDGESGEGLVIEAVNIEDDMTYDVWLSADTMKTRFARLYEKHGTLKDVKVKVWKKLVELKKWGETPIYFVKEITDEEIEDGTV